MPAILPIPPHRPPPSNPPPAPEEALPTPAAAIRFRLKAKVFQIRRTLQNLRTSAPRRLTQHEIDFGIPVIAESRSPLYSSAVAGELSLQAGKVHNLRLATQRLHGLVVPAGECFSFWANVGPAISSRGYVNGRELREGCIIPNIGGGLCQLSNSLYDAALSAGMGIVERHSHSYQIPGAQFAGRDATVFWNYVDLRFRSTAAFQIAIQLTATELIVQLRCSSTPSAFVPSTPRPAPTQLVESCETCGVTDCFRHPSALHLPGTNGTAWIMDAYWPEFDQWMNSQRSSDDTLLLPLDSKRLSIGPYRWNSTGFRSVHHAPMTVTSRSYASRKLARQGAARQRALLTMDEAMANALTRNLPPLCGHVIVSQNLLPHLWKSGHLGGRTFDVLMTRYPLHEIQKALDAAAAKHPDSATLADFRAPEDLLRFESEALAAAQRWISPHTGIARLAGDRALLLPWHMPPTKPRPPGKRIIFPASTLGRKGAYELREAARNLDAEIVLCGPILESPDFWNGIRTAPAAEDWLADAAAVALPAWSEHQPRRLLQAIAAGIPVIATPSCGIPAASGVTLVPEGDVPALLAALRLQLSDISSPMR